MNIEPDPEKSGYRFSEQIMLRPIAAGAANSHSRQLRSAMMRRGARRSQRFFEMIRFVG
jgi:hypothetical protein